ncbi:alpha/beta fold hydrolase [Streptomyces malaysiensis]|uniref:Uncharacterized protein n=1 Tax=Streptomyces malaysiensis subsp. samsunensis TaxID=459658 RepID=A0A9X2LVI5_STRMQ|nr:hypothetical protein [Streptomyces samsunensis]MCQ8829975.1 hypothetical protein [Streptomyces samsunensis]
MNPASAQTPTTVPAVPARIAPPARHNFCTPLPLSRELAHGIPNAGLTVFEDAGELIELERPARFFAEVNAFVEGLNGPDQG